MSLTFAMPLCFDLSRPFGPLDDGVECCVSRHSISFRKGTHGGYTHYVQCTPLCKADAIHVVTFRMSGLVQEYGLNAIAVVLHNEDQDIAELSQSEFCEYSQQFAPFPECCVTVALDDVSGSLQLLVTEAPIEVGSKRARSSEDGTAANDEPQWYHRPEHRWTCSEKNDVKVWSKVTKIKLGDALPRIGLRLCPLLSSKATIAECPVAVQDVLLESSRRTLQFYKPGAVDMVSTGPKTGTTSSAPPLVQPQPSVPPTAAGSNIVSEVRAAVRDAIAAEMARKKRKK